MDMVVGFDISTHLPGQPLFHGHPQLQSYLPSILEDITSMRGVSCGAGAEMQVLGGWQRRGAVISCRDALPCPILTQSYSCPLGGLQCSALGTP